MKTKTLAFVLVSFLSTVDQFCSTTFGQELPTRDEDHFQFQKNNKNEIFYDTKLIPDGSEVSTFLQKDLSSRYFFIVEENASPLAIYITPCSSSVTCYIRYQTKPEDYDIDTADKKPRDEILSQSMNTNKKTKKKKNRSSSSQEQLLVTHTGSDVIKFENVISPTGLYSVEIVALERDTTVYLYATTTPGSERLYPELPTDADVKVISATNDVISVVWKASPTDIQHRIPIEYCVSVNRKRNFGTRCAVLADRYGDIPPTIPPNAGFGFPWEKQARRNRNKNSRQSTHKPPDDRDHYTCIGNKTAYTFNRLEPGVKYYIDVFALNALTNGSTSYVGTNVTAVATGSVATTCQQKSEKVAHIRRGKVYRYQTKEADCELTMEYVLRERLEQRLLINIRMCSAIDASSLKTVVEFEKSPVETEVLSESPIRIISVSRPVSGSYRIRVSGSEEGVVFRMAVTIAEDDNPFPVLPNDARIRVVEPEVDPPEGECGSSMTLMWNITNDDLQQQQQQQYCLYMQDLKVTTTSNRGGTPSPHPSSSASGKSSRRRNPNTCSAVETLRRRAKKIMCKTVSSNAGKKRMHVMTGMVEVVSGLGPDTSYTFDVIVTKQGSKESVTYDSLTTKTRNC